MKKMLKNKIKIYFFFVLILALPTNGYSKIGYDTLSQLIHNAPYIAKGKISLQNEKVILNIKKMLKGKSQNELTISFLHDFEAPDPKFSDGEEVILFLHIPDFSKGYIIPGLGAIPMPEVKEGEMYLFGLGDQAKWPKRYSGKYKFMPYPKLQDTASLEAINNVVQKILKVEDSNNLDEKIKLCTEYIKSSDKLLQYTAMEYALDSGFLDSFYKKDKKILNQFYNEIIKLNLINDDESTIRSEAIRFLRLAEVLEVIPLLIPKITDSDRLVRSATLEILFRHIRDSKDNKYFSPDDSMDKLKSIQMKWNEWWLENKDKFTKKE